MKPVEVLFDSAEWGPENPRPENLKPGELYAVKEGKLTIGNKVLDCVVLNDGTRVFTEESLMRFFGLDV